MMEALSYFSYQPVLPEWCNQDHGMVHIKEPLLLIGKSSPCGGSGFPLSLSEWPFTICLTPYNRKSNLFSALLNKTFPSFIHSLYYLYLYLGFRKKTHAINVLACNWT